MTPKEAKKILEMLKDYDFLGERDIEALDMAIWFLSQHKTILDTISKRFLGYEILGGNDE